MGLATEILDGKGEGLAMVTRAGGGGLFDSDLEKHLAMVGAAFAVAAVCRCVAEDVPLKEIGATFVVVAGMLFALTSLCWNASDENRVDSVLLESWQWFALLGAVVTVDAEWQWRAASSFVGVGLAVILWRSRAQRRSARS